jgi:Protein of unknown function (DUF1761)
MAPHVNPLAVVVAALSAFLVGGIWYSPLGFARPWMDLNGFTQASLKERGGTGRIFGVSFLLVGIASTNLAFFLGGPETTAAWGATAGGLTALWVAAAFGVTYLFEHRPMRLFLIDAGYHAVAFPLMGLILGAWR